MSTNFCLIVIGSDALSVQGDSGGVVVGERRPPSLGWEGFIENHTTLLVSCCRLEDDIWREFVDP